MAPKPAAALAPEIQRFEASLRIERRASTHTLQAYLSDLAQYAGYLAARGALVQQEIGTGGGRG